MCSAPKPKPIAQAVPLPEETTKPAIVDNEAARKNRRSGRASLTIPAAGASTATGMSGLNIPM